MNKYIVQTVHTVQQVIEARSPSEAVARADATFNQFFHDGDAPGKGIVIGGHCDVGDVRTIRDGRYVTIGHADGADYYPLADDGNE